MVCYLTMIQMNWMKKEDKVECLGLKPSRNNSSDCLYNKKLSCLRLMEGLIELHFSNNLFRSILVLSNGVSRSSSKAPVFFKKLSHHFLKFINKHDVKCQFKITRIQSGIRSSYTRMDKVKFFECYLPQILFGPLFNTLTHIQGQNVLPVTVQFI